MKRFLVLAIVAAVSLGGCASFATKVHQFSANYQTVVADINADIAATAPDVAVACSNLQAAGMLVAPFVPSSTKAQAAFAAANAAITSYCQQIPTNIPQVLAQVQAAVVSARAAYAKVKAGSA